MFVQGDSSEDEISGGGDQESQSDSDSSNDRSGKLVSRNRAVERKNKRYIFL